MNSLPRIPLARVVARERQEAKPATQEGGQAGLACFLACASLACSGVPWVRRRSALFAFSTLSHALERLLTFWRLLGPFMALLCLLRLRGALRCLGSRRGPTLASVAQVPAGLRLHSKTTALLVQSLRGGQQDGLQGRRGPSKCFQSV